MKDVNVLFVIISSILSSAFAVGAFYSSVLGRLRRLEKNQELNENVRERLASIETKINILLKETS